MVGLGLGWILVRFGFVFGLFRHWLGFVRFRLDFAAGSVMFCARTALVLIRFRLCSG